MGAGRPAAPREFSGYRRQRWIDREQTPGLTFKYQAGTNMSDSFTSLIMGKKLYSDEELLSRLQEFAAELGRPPSQNEMNDSGPHAAATYAARFGS